MSEFEDNAVEAGVEVSIVVANYNGERFIDEAIRSVIDQSLRGLEIIISDDASTDASVQIVKNLGAQDSRVRLIESAMNAGPAAARNRALELATGRWIAIMDCD